MKTSIYAISLLLFLLPYLLPAQYTQQDSIDFKSRLTLAYDYAWNNPDTGLIVAETFIEEARNIDYGYGEAHAYIFKADCYMSKGDYARTIYNLLHARNICNNKGISSLDQRINRPFGELYIELGQPHKAIDHQLLALQQSTEETETVIVTKGLADAYWATGQLDSAYYYAKPLFERAGQFWGAIGITTGKILTSWVGMRKHFKPLKSKPDLLLS